MGSSKRVQNEPAWILHHRPYSDTSRILDVITREHGRISLVARGSRSAKSRLRGILRPFMPLSMSWLMRSDLGTLTGAEMHGAPVALNGEALISGYYVNELLLKLLHRHDPQPEIFDAYGETVRNLGGTVAVAPLLRQFELELLRLLGYALNLDHDSESLDPLRPDHQYEYRPEQGPVPVSGREGPMVFLGGQLDAIRRQEFGEAGILSCANRLLRGVIAYHLDGRELKSRKVLRDIRRSGEVPGRQQEQEQEGNGRA